MGILNIKEIQMPEFAEDDRLSSWAPQAESTVCWGKGRLAALAVNSRGEGEQARGSGKSCLKRVKFGKDIDALKEYPCCSVSSCWEGSISSGCCSGWEGGSLNIQRQLCPGKCVGQVKGNWLQRGR